MLRTPCALACIGARIGVFGLKTASGKIFGARYYAPWLGRWTTADPLGLQAGLNLYLYGRAGPLNFVDPNGLQDVPAGPKEITRWSTRKEAAANELIAQNKQITASAAGAAVAGTAAGFAKPTDNRSIGERVARGWFASQHGSSPEKLVTDAFRDPTDPDVIKERVIGAAMRHPVVGTLYGGGTRFLATLENIQTATDETLPGGARAEAVSNVVGTGVGLLANAVSAVLGGKGAASGPGAGSLPSGGAGSGGGGGGPTLLYRAMKEGPGGQPLLGPTARTLGVRTVPPSGISKPFTPDISVAGGKVKPGGGGMSVTPDDPALLPTHRKPASLGGTGSDPVWVIEEGSLGPQLQHRRDPTKPTRHGYVEPAKEMSLADYEQAIAATVEFWRKL